MILNNITEKLKVVWSLVLRAYLAVQYYSIVYLNQVQSITDYLSALLFKKGLIAETSQIKISKIFNYGIHLVIFLNVICFDFLKGQSCKYLNRGKSHDAEYLFTIDWAHPDANILNTEHSEMVSEHKCAHVLKLTNGNFAAQPNNRILWNVPNFTNYSRVPDYKVQTTEWNVENKNWVTEDSDKMFYDTEDK
jgi:hypothetical protein